MREWMQAYTKEIRGILKEETKGAVSGRYPG
jgi:hypothetical protein